MRAAAFALLAWASWRALVPAAMGERVIDSAALHGESRGALDARGEAAGDLPGAGLGDVLSLDGATHVRVQGVVSPSVRDAVAAARRAGGRVSWSADSVPVWAAAALPERGPGGRTVVSIVGDDGECRGTGTVGSAGRGRVECGGTGVLFDTLGLLDTVRLSEGGATATITPGRGLRFVGPQAEIPLMAAPPDTMPWRVLVLARAGWEAKFVMAALEEQGWVVSARLAVAPGVEVTQGALTLGAPDVIVVLDSARVGPDVAAITQFVRNGGGVVLAGDGALMLQAVAPARAGPGAVAAMRAPRSDAVVTRESLPLRALSSLRADAVVLDSRSGTPAIVARAEGNGRVVQVGYDDTWRWRMQGSTTAVADHREFWARALASAAPERGTPPRAPEGAPRARLVDAWGPMTALPAPRHQDSQTHWLWPLAALLLVAEWASRRTRGAA